MNILNLPGMAQMFATSAMCDVRINECHERWHASKKLPRKAKKLERKHILLDHAIFSHGRNLFNW